MSILIKGMEMPEEGHLIVRIYANGEVCEPTECAGVWGKVATAVPVPPHGRLIDGDVAEVIQFTEEDAVGKDFYDGILYAADFISKQPTILQAEEGE